MKLIFKVMLMTTLSMGMVHAEHIEELEANCRFEILRPGKVPYILNGVVRNTTGQDYLTLEPATTSDAKVTARILLTSNYHPVSLHPRGNTVNQYVAGDLATTNRVELTHEENGIKYNLVCETNR